MRFVRKPGFEVFCHLALVSDEVQGSVSGRCGVLVRSPQYYCDVWVLGSGFWCHEGQRAPQASRAPGNRRGNQIDNGKGRGLSWDRTPPGVDKIFIPRVDFL